MKELEAMEIKRDHHWFPKLEKYNVEEEQEDEMELALNIVREGDVFQCSGQYRSAEDKYEIALEMLNEILQEKIVHPVVVRVLQAMAANHRVQARFLAAKALYEKALSMTLKLYTEESVEVKI